MVELQLGEKLQAQGEVLRSTLAWTPAHLEDLMYAIVKGVPYALFNARSQATGQQEYNRNTTWQSTATKFT